MKGGYIQVDVTGLDLSKSTDNITGFYKKFDVLSNETKPIILNGIVKGTYNVTPSYCTISKSVSDGNTLIDILMDGYAIQIKDDDSIGIAVLGA